MTDHLQNVTNANKSLKSKSFVLRICFENETNRFITEKIAKKLILITSGSCSSEMHFKMTALYMCTRYTLGDSQHHSGEIIANLTVTNRDFLYSKKMIYMFL